MKRESLVDLIIEDVMIQNDAFYIPEEEKNVGEIISSDKKRYSSIKFMSL